MASNTKYPVNDNFFLIYDWKNVLLREWIDDKSFAFQRGYVRSKTRSGLVLQGLTSSPKTLSGFMGLYNYLTRRLWSCNVQITEVIFHCVLDVNKNLLQLIFIVRFQQEIHITPRIDEFLGIGYQSPFWVSEFKTAQLRIVFEPLAPLIRVKGNDGPSARGWNRE